MTIFQEMAYHFGIPLAKEKIEGPSYYMSDIFGDRAELSGDCVSLSVDTLQRLRALLDVALRRKKRELSFLQQLLGHLNFACPGVSWESILQTASILHEGSS